jgi:hypothetical protein
MSRSPSSHHQQGSVMLASPVTDHPSWATYAIAESSGCMSPSECRTCDSSELTPRSLLRQLLRLGLRIALFSIRSTWIVGAFVPAPLIPERPNSLILPRWSLRPVQPTMPVSPMHRDGGDRNTRFDEPFVSMPSRTHPPELGSPTQLQHSSYPTPFRLQTKRSSSDPLS